MWEDIGKEEFGKSKARGAFGVEVIEEQRA